MRIAKIDSCDIANGPGARLSVWVSGCSHHCKNCFNSELWDFEKGIEYNDIIEQKIIVDLGREYITGLSILGGDPLEPIHQKDICKLVKKVKEKYPNKTIFLWTGYLWEEIKDYEILKYIDTLIDGPFIEELKDLSLPLRGSSNQRIIDVQQSLKNNEVTEDKRWQKI